MLSPTTLFALASGSTLLIAHYATHYLIRSSPILTLFAILAFESCIWLAYLTLIYPHYVSPLRHLPTAPVCPDSQELESSDQHIAGRNHVHGTFEAHW